MMNRDNEYQKTCCVCGCQYFPFALTSYESQIGQGHDMCRDCLNLMLDEKYYTKRNFNDIDEIFRGYKISKKNDF